MLVTLTGSNDHVRKSELARRIAAFEVEYDATSIERLDGEEATTDAMRGAVQSLPFLSPRKLVVLREPGKQKEFAEHCTDILKDISESTDVIIYEPKLDKRSLYYKTLKKMTEFLEFQELDRAGLGKWAVAYVAQQGGKLSPHDANLLIDRVGMSQQLVQSELDKLLNYDAVITPETIILLTEPTPQSTIFELLEAVFEGKLDRAFMLYDEQRALKVEPQAIIAMVAWQLHILAIVKAGNKKSVDEIAKVARLNPFVIRKSQGIARRLSLEQIKQSIAGILQLDLRLKSTMIDADEALRLYLLQLAKTITE